MLIDDADRPAKWYFALKANLTGTATGAEMVHPMDGSDAALAVVDRSGYCSGNT
jgi:hypothetical protein